MACKKISLIKGHTLIELMVALALGLFLLAMILASFQVIGQISNRLNCIIHLQETGLNGYLMMRNDSKTALGILNPMKFSQKLAIPLVANSDPLCFKKNNAHLCYFVTKESKNKKEDEYKLNRVDLLESRYKPLGVLNGVQSMQVSYAMASGQNINFESANQIKNFRKVRGVKIKLLTTYKEEEKSFSFILALP